MKVTGRDKLKGFMSKHTDAEKWLSAWLYEAQEANWNTPGCIKAKYKSASFLKDNVVIFNVKGNKYRMKCTVAYDAKVVVIDWVGTHAEYSKIQF